MPRARQTPAPDTDENRDKDYTPDPMPASDTISLGDVLVKVFFDPGDLVTTVEVTSHDSAPTPFVVKADGVEVFRRRPALQLAHGTRHAMESAVRKEVHDHYGEEGYRLSDSAAAAIASWYQTPVEGLVFAQFVSHQSVDPDALAAECEREIAAHTGRADWTVRSLKMLAAYARSV